MNIEMDEQLERYMASPDCVPELLGKLHQQGVSYKRIAEEIGVTYMAVYRWTKGTSTPRPIRTVGIQLMLMSMLEEMQNRAETARKALVHNK